jgi:hypothetical protein
METGRMLYETDIQGQNYKLGVYGIFDTQKVRWTYHVISYEKKAGGAGNIMLTYAICGTYKQPEYSDIRKYGKQFETKELGQKFIEDYKMKWESGSNITKQEMRDRKIDDILDEE